MTTNPIQVRNPRSGSYDYEIVPVSTEEVAQACQDLRVNQKDWEASGLDGRLSVLRAFAKAVGNHRQAILDALSTDTGRGYISAMEVDGIGPSIERWAKTAEAHTKVTGKSSALPFIKYTVGYRVYPLVGVISPWNFPLTLSLIDALPALVAGAAVIIKPSEVTPRFAAPLRRAIAEVPELAAVLKIVDGAGETGAAIVDNVDTICFTGSVATGRKVGEQAARNFIPSFLELGGKDPAIVLKSADVDRAATSLLRASILNTGQACQSIERIYVAEEIYDQFLFALCEKASQVTLNATSPTSGMIGPIIFEKQAAIIADQLEDAVQKGAQIHTGGKVEDHGGMWCPPTVITGLSDDMKIMQEETFGPLLPIIPFKTPEEAISKANASEYGLSAAVFAATEEEALQIARQIEAGGISINDAALTGLMHEAEKNSFKLSGMGASRMGKSGYTRFFRKQSYMTNTADVFEITQFDESNAHE